MSTLSTIIDHRWRINEKKMGRLLRTTIHTELKLMDHKASGERERFNQDY